MLKKTYIQVICHSIHFEHLSALKKVVSEFKRLSSAYDSIKGLGQKGAVWYWIKELYSKTSFKWAEASEGLEFKRKSGLETDKPSHGLQVHFKPSQFLKLDNGDTRLLLNLLPFWKQIYEIWGTITHLLPHILSTSNFDNTMSVTYS